MGVATLERFLLTPQAGIPLQPKSCCTRKLAMVDGLRCVRNESVHLFPISMLAVEESVSYGHTS